jgi:DNA repair exonuclease SbcCD ATPase subunit
MKLRRLLLQSFGCLQGEFHFSADRANLVLEPNERGKSTLAAAILAGLYGFPPGQRKSESRPLIDAEIHRPWRGEGYLVEMDVEAGGELFTVRRDFASRKEQVFEGRSGKEITGRFQKSRDHLDFAGVITGLDREDFTRTAFLRQSEMLAIRDASGITAALQRMATSQQGDVAAAEATGILTEALRQFRGQKIRRGKIESELSGIEEEIGSLRARIQEMEGRRASVEGELRELEATTKQAGELEDELERLEYLVIASGRAEDEKRLMEESSDREELEAREKEFQELSRYQAFPVAGTGRLAELKARTQALAEEEQRLADRRAEEIDRPIAEWKELASRVEGFGSLEPSDGSRLAALETDLAAAWKTGRESRRSLRSLDRGMRSEGDDPDRIRELAGRFSSLGAEDRRFLLDYGGKAAEARSALSDAERQSAGVDELLADAGHRSGATGRARGVLAAAGGAALAASLLLWFLAPWYVAAGSAALGALLLVLRLTAFAGSAPRDEVIESVQSSRESFERLREAKRAALRQLTDRLDGIAARVGGPRGEEFVAGYREYEAISDRSAELAALDRSISDSAASVAQAAGSIRALMEAAGHHPRFGAVTPTTTRIFKDALTEHAGIQKELTALAQRGASIEEDRTRLSGERAALRAEASAIIVEGGMDPELDPGEAVKLFEEASRHRERYEVLKKEIIPGLVRRAMGKKNDNLERQIAATGAILRRKEAESPGLRDLTPEKSHKEYIEARDRLMREARQVAERKLELAHRLGEVLREYRRDYPDTQRWLREWEAQRERAVEFKESVELAREVLDHLSKEAYAEWADVLNERASDTLAYLVPGYEDLRFDEDLSFSLREGRSRERRNQSDIDVRFSAGTRDQVYLAARLAMAGYLSGAGARLPLILDDPFSSFDDDRFARAMSVMLEKFSKRHQLLILSCHEARHRAWQDRNPELFADRVRIMSLQPVTS